MLLQVHVFSTRCTFCSLPGVLFSGKSSCSALTERWSASPQEAACFVQTPICKWLHYHVFYAIAGLDTAAAHPIRHPTGHGNQRPVGRGGRVMGYVWFQPGLGLKPSIRSAFCVFMTLALPCSSPRTSTRPPK